MTHTIKDKGTHWRIAVSESVDQPTALSDIAASMEKQFATTELSDIWIPTAELARQNHKATRLERHEVIGDDEDWDNWAIWGPNILWYVADIAKAVAAPPPGVIFSTEIQVPEAPESYRFELTEWNFSKIEGLAALRWGITIVEDVLELYARIGVRASVTMVTGSQDDAGAEMDVSTAMPKAEVFAEVVPIQVKISDTYQIGVKFETSSEFYNLSTGFRNPLTGQGNDKLFDSWTSKVSFGAPWDALPVSSGDPQDANTMSESKPGVDGGVEIELSYSKLAVAEHQLEISGKGSIEGQLPLGLGFFVDGEISASGQLIFTLEEVAL